jgi:hypothetical protein
MLNDPVVIVGAARTPMGGFGSGRSRSELDFARAKSASTETAIGNGASVGACHAQ